MHRSGRRRHGRGTRLTPGTALYVDAEMGRKMFIHNRLRAAGVVVPTFEYIDAMGLDISRPDDVAWLERTIRTVAANFVVYDSLRRLTPSKAENDSDDMAPVIGSLAKVARDTGAAILLIHHKGDGDKSFRGSTAIRDQADALFLLTPEAGSDVLRLTCRDQSCKPTRYAKPPEDVFLKIDPDAGGISGAERPTLADRALAAAPERQKIKDTILAALPVKTQAEAARACDLKPDHGTFKSAWKELAEAGAILHRGEPKTWQAGSQSLGLADCLPYSAEAMDLGRVA